MMDELAAANRALPVQVLEANYKTDILTLRAEEGILISIRCPFDIAFDGVLESFPGGDVRAPLRLQGLDLQSLTTRHATAYPDLLIRFDKNTEIHVRPPHSGEEMWLIDVPGIAFISP